MRQKKQQSTSTVSQAKIFLRSVRDSLFSLICAGILEQSMGARNREGTNLSYCPANLCSLTGQYDNPTPTRFLASIDCS